MATSIALLPVDPVARVHPRHDNDRRRDPDALVSLSDLRASIERLREEREALFAELRRVCLA